MIYLITGGERSGKSSYAQKLALELSEHPVYVATARKWDGNFEKRIQKHQSERGVQWDNIEEEKHIGNLDLKNKIVVIDCVTLWLTNFFTDTKYDIETSLTQAKTEFDKIKSMNGTFIFVTNEIGMGVHAGTEIGRKFVELQGWMNQYIAGRDFLHTHSLPKMGRAFARLFKQNITIFPSHWLDCRNRIFYFIISFSLNFPY